MLQKSYRVNSGTKQQLRPNPWDFIALVIIFAILVVLSWAGLQMVAPYKVGEYLPISLSPANLFNYSVRTVLRMILALGISIIFTFAVGAWAAKSKRAEAIIIPMIDVLQAIPVLSFLSITVVGFISLFPGSLLGPECASIFAIFTAQAWNMTLGFYQSLKTVPSDLLEVGRMYHLSAWQKFWKIEVPYAMPSLLWNMMMSMSASWFFVVASEAISIANNDIHLPGVGSYIDLAIQQANVEAVCYAVLAMLVVIIIYDQLFFRPLLYWSERFQENMEIDDEVKTKSWFINIIQKTKLLLHWSYYVGLVAEKVLNFSWFNRPNKIITTVSRLNLSWLYFLLVFASLAISGYVLVEFIIKVLSLHEVFYVSKLGLFTAIRVFVLIILSSVVWVPTGIYIGKRVALAHKLQPIVQFLASFPANIVFPFVVISIVRYQLNVEIWTTPLMILGSQWYILFNVIAGTLAIPKELHYATENIGLRGLSWWTKFMLPGILPYYITGAITAAGGAWNASIVAELVAWGDVSLQATGLGAYIAEYTRLGDFHRIALGTLIMCLYVLILNKLLWQPLYKLVESRVSPLE